ncbi:MAG: hypothetical protein NZT92_19000 [Abditibacteriales bacterium]|nr:hypothetical protein [Abditibacteriales bacterium]
MKCGAIRHASPTPYFYYGWQFLRYGENLQVEVTGISQPSPTEAVVKFRYRWSPIRKTEENLNRIRELASQASLGDLLEIALPRWEGESEAILRLYDDGWRVERIESQTGGIIVWSAVFLGDVAPW